MSDEPQKSDAPIRVPAGIIEHWCEHPSGCRRWGSWGFARGRQSVWFCFEHRPEE
ncbi:hypothetical protein [Mesorhizobium sp. CAU 1732]|uniref:hypothetical protein n=1 Tax=Mesorhizobium sp. CAU 1732 TaxID=3140358 RepID=UPI0032614F63